MATKVSTFSMCYFVSVSLTTYSVIARSFTFVDDGVLITPIECGRLKSRGYNELFDRYRLSARRW